MSEPGAGSDLLNLKTTAVEKGDYYIVNGQKTWASTVHLSRYSALYTKTDDSVPPTKGISFFVLDNELPGVTIRPLINMAGYKFHSEVFLDDVHIPKDYLVGGKNQGFPQLLKGLDVDRFWARWDSPHFYRRLLNELVQYCKETKRDGVLLANDPIIRDSLAQSAIEIEAVRVLFYHMAGLLQKGTPLTADSSMPKVMADEVGQRLIYKGAQILGPYSQLSEATKWAPLHGMIQYLNSIAPGITLAGGTSEVVRNAAARVLGLPRYN
jgi:hypothetical protein